MLPERELLEEVRRVFPRKKWTGVLPGLIEVSRQAEGRKLPHRFTFVCRTLELLLVNSSELPETLRQGILGMSYSNTLRLLVRATLECGHKPHRLADWLQRNLEVSMG